MLVVKSNMNTCYACGEKILTYQELSIEHKKPWENRSVELFWDLDNIAFSHLRCNKPHIYKGRQRIVVTNKMRCYKCKKILCISMFHKNKSNWHGLSKECKKCCCIRNKKSWQKRKLKHGQ